MYVFSSNKSTDIKHLYFYVRIIGEDMKVVYEKSIGDKVVAAIQEAKEGRKEIEYIILTEKEAIELYDTHFGHSFCRKGVKVECEEVADSYFYGIRLKVEGYDEY